MNERLLQFIWQFQYFNKAELLSFEGENIQVIHPGILNKNQGPDFTDARIRIGNTLLAGNIELHIKTSDWEKHGHQQDPLYQNIILHVVWEHDRSFDSKIPVLELQSRVSTLLLERYRLWMEQLNLVPCSGQLKELKPLVWKSWKERLLVERLDRKTAEIKEYLCENNQHWEESFWWLLAKHFGSKTNARAFEALAKTLPLKILARHKNNIVQLEALLLGQAGLLNKKFHEAYPKMLKAEYRFLQKKYRLTPCFEPVYFLRMRPVNFPTIRLAQLAMLIHQSSHLFSLIKEVDELNILKARFDITANDYWHYHYVFDEVSSFQPKHLGRQMSDSIVINVIGPALFAWGRMMKQEEFVTKAFRWLEQIDAEQNSITKKYTELGIENRCAFDSQALVELKNSYCDQKRCLDCAVGVSLLKILPAN
jgi:hypothetical protein